MNEDKLYQLLIDQFVVYWESIINWSVAKANALDSKRRKIHLEIKFMLNYDMYSMIVQSAIRHAENKYGELIEILDITDRAEAMPLIYDLAETCKNYILEEIQ